MALRMEKSCGFRLVKQTTLHLHLTFFVHYFAVLSQPAMRTALPDFIFSGGYEHQITIF